MVKTHAVNLGQYVKQIIQEKGLSLRDIQRNSGGKITSGYISGIINGNAMNVTVEKLKALAAGLGVEAHDLFSAAQGAPPQTENQYFKPLDPVELLDLMLIVLRSPDMLSLIETSARLPLNDQKLVLNYVKKLLESE